jgi:type II secretory pathway predicted ATPase ExeA
MHTLQEIASRIRDWQQNRNLSDNELCRRFAGLGSTKTYKRILDGNLDELDPERQAHNYEQVLNLIEIESATTAVDEPTYDDLPHIVSVRLAVQDAIGEAGNNRLVIVEGPSGSGKTTAGRKLAERFGRKVVLSEADETWKDSLSNMLGGLLRALGVKSPPNGSESRKTLLLEKLRETPVALVIDEAHHLGQRTLNLVKTILNQTPSQVVFLAIPTLLRRLESSAFEEARQLTKNRLCERVRLDGCDTASVEKFLTRRLSFEKDTARPCAKTLSERAGQFGNWNFVNLVCRKARQLAGKDAVDSDTFAKAMQAAAASR